MILSNQIKCNKCGDEIFSAHCHDYQTCSCGAVSVDGGMDYLRRAGTDFTEMSVVWESPAIEACKEALTWADETGRNNLGRICAIARYLRDAGFELVRKE